jgi:hypothetical protein
MQAILSGTNGGVGKIRVQRWPDTPELTLRCQITFFIENQGGMQGSLKIYSHGASETVPVVSLPESVDFVETTYFLTYLKRSQNLLANPGEFVTLLVSERGILLQTVSKDHAVVVYVADISAEDLQSYC